jgi:hypothetical protein
VEAAKNVGLNTLFSGYLCGHCRAYRIDNRFTSPW